MELSKNAPSSQLGSITANRRCEDGQIGRGDVWLEGKYYTVPPVLSESHWPKTGVGFPQF